jgi:hypothetical protein
MNISGPRSLSGVSAPHQQELDLRPFQRVTAQILSVTGTTALLSIEGYPVVAQLASADQAANLLPQQIAQFIVTQRTGQKITLKVIGDDQNPESLARSAAQGPEIAARLLEQHGIPLTTTHLIIARALLKKHLPVTPSLLNELQETLSTYGSWGSKEADLAAMLKATGLPVNAESLALISRQAAQIGDSLARLIARLIDMADQDLPEELLKQRNANVQRLKNMVLKSDGAPSQLAEQLKMAVQMLGTSLEGIVLERMKGSEVLPENNLLSLVRLQQALEHAGKNELAETIGTFLQDLQQSQFLNAKPDAAASLDSWLEMGFAVQNTQQKETEGFSSVRLRIARDPNGDSSKINPVYTRLILQVDIKPGQTVEIDLSFVDKNIKTAVTAPDPLWCQKAQEEWSTLEQALQSLGFTPRDSQIAVGAPHSFERLRTFSGPPLMAVDIEA